MTRILGHRSDIRTVFYEASLSGGERHVFSIPDIHSMLPRNPSCLTCSHSSATSDGFSDGSGRNCTTHRATMSPSGLFYILECLGPYKTWTELRTVEDNQLSMNRLLVHFSFSLSLSFSLISCPSSILLTLTLTCI